MEFITITITNIIISPSPRPDPAHVASATKKCFYLSNTRPLELCKIYQQPLVLHHRVISLLPQGRQSNHMSETHYAHKIEDLMAIILLLWRIPSAHYPENLYESKGHFQIKA